jgi:molybdopterin molybdotransferase
VGRHHHVDPAELVPLDRYRRDVLAAIRPLDVIELGLLEAHGCVLAGPVWSDRDVPPFDNSAMDGYAVRVADLGGGTELKVVGEVAAGATGAALEPGQAVRIMTGAPVPAGADAVIPVELAEEGDGVVRFFADAQPGDNVRRAGEDLRAGTPVLEAGTELGPAELGMLAVLGHAQVQVRPRPRVVVISSGNELVEPGQPLGPGQIYDANSFTLTALAREAGARAARHGRVPDDRAALAETFEGSLIRADMLLISGGVSAGRYDLVKEVLADLGDVRFSKVGMQPGMPQAFGHIGAVPCFGLPGNPVSAYVSFEVFVRPALRRMQGRVDLNRPRIRATLEEDVRSPEHKVSFLRVTLTRSQDGWRARTTGAQGSGILSSVARADGLAEIPADRTSVPAGERVLVHLLAS